MGIGMGFVMSPMSTAAMNSVDQAKAGLASGTLSMSRMVGGTFGVAAVGALVAGLGRAKIDERLPQLPAGTRANLANNLGQGSAAGRDRATRRLTDHAGQSARGGDPHQRASGGAGRRGRACGARTRRGLSAARRRAKAGARLRRNRGR